MNEKLPEGWVRTTLGEVAEVSGGIQKSPKRRPSKNPLPMLRVANVGFGTIDLEEVHEIEVFEGEEERYALRVGDILVVEGNGSLSQIGRAAMWRGGIPRCVHQNHLLRVRARDLLPDFLELYLHSPRARSDLESVASSTSGLHVLSGSKLRRLPVVVPPIREQKLIVTALEEHLSLLENAEAFVGRLQHEAGSLLDAAVLQLIPSDAPSSALADILDVFSDCPHRTPKYSEDGDFSALRPRDVVGGVLDLDGSAKVTEDEYLLQSSRHVPCEGDVIYSRELSYGWAVVVPPDARLCLSQGMVAMRPASSIHPEYLRLILNSRIGRDQAHLAATGSAHPHLNLRDIKRYLVPVLDLDAQERVVEKYQVVREGVERLHSSTETVKRRAELCRRSMLVSAFKGELLGRPRNGEGRAVAADSGLALPLHDHERA